MAVSNPIKTLFPMPTFFLQRQNRDGCWLYLKVLALVSKFEVLALFLALRQWSCPSLDLCLKAKSKVTTLILEGKDRHMLFSSVLDWGQDIGLEDSKIDICW